MNGKKIARIVLDVALTAMIVAEMFIQFTGVFLHEVIGFAFFATVVTHLALSAKWIKNTASTAKEGKMTGRRTALAVMGILLAINMVVLGVSSVAISTILESAGFVWALGSYATWAAIHSVSSYTLCALVTVHLGMHWAFLASAFRVPYDPSRRQAINAGVHAVAAVGALALGVMAVNQVAPFASISGNGNGNGNGDGNGNGAESNAGTTAQSRGNKAFNSVNDVQGSSSSSSASSSVTQGAKEKKKKDDSSSSSSVPSSSSNPEPSNDSGSSNAPNVSYQEEAPSQGEYETYAEPETTTEVSGICTLCRKRCPLSDPKCDRPYREGLL